ncbi:MAG: transcription termination factor NusA [Thermodesulfobacteriota bacterium]
MIIELKRIIDQISRDKGIDRDLLVNTLVEAVLSAAKKRYGQRRDIEVQYNEEMGEVELFQFRRVVDKVKDEQTEVSLEEAKSLDPEVQLGDELGSKMEDVADLGRIAAQSAKQVIIQKMKDAEKGVIYDIYKERKGEIVNGIVQRFERGDMIINLGRTDAVLPRKEQIPKRSYRQGDRIRAYLKEVRDDVSDRQLILSRTCNDFLIKLFVLEVPEIAEGIVKIINASRDPGSRAKIAVTSTESDVDPVGACVGMKGSRVQNVVQELQGEKIDIVHWSPDSAKYVSNALAPVQISLVVVDEDKHTMLVIVPDDQLSLAIGRQGQNVRLASQLIGWKIDVKTEHKYAKMREEGFQSLLTLNSVNDKMVEMLYDGGITSLTELAEASANDVAELIGVDRDTAGLFIDEAARKLVDDREKQERKEVEVESDVLGPDSEENI